MRLTWWGHSCFLLETAAGTRLLTDPFDPGTGYALSGVDADVVTISHDHHDHNHLAAVNGAPEVIRDPGAHEAFGIRITGFPSWHDGEQGRLRGQNLLYLMEADGVRVLHLGDLGHRLPRETVDAIGPVDAVLCPIGGKFTVDAAGAWQVINDLAPRVAVPMHYHTPDLKFLIADETPFIQQAGEWTVRRITDRPVELQKDALPEKAVWVLNYR